MIRPVRVNPVPAIWARPKARIFACPFGRTKMLPGLMSRCTTPFWCA
jgi:hypothetical protein